MKLVFKVALVVLALIVPLVASAQDGSPTIEVIASGTGSNNEDALKRALVTAVEQAIGLYVDAETIVANEEVVDRILSLSDGFVQSYKIIGTPRKDVHGLITVRVKALVQKNKLVKKLEDSNVTSSSIDGTSLFAAAVTKNEYEANAAEIALSIFEDFPGNILEARVVGEPRIVDQNEEKALVGVMVQYKVNTEKYKSWFERVCPLLEKIATRSEKLRWNLKTSGATSLNSTSNNSLNRHFGRGSAPNPFCFEQLEFLYGDPQRQSCGSLQVVDVWGALYLSETERKDGLYLGKATPGYYYDGPAIATLPADADANNVLLVSDGLKTNLYYLKREIFKVIYQTLYSWPIAEISLVDGRGEVLAYPRAGSSADVAIFCHLTLGYNSGWFFAATPIYHLTKMPFHKNSYEIAYPWELSPTYIVEPITPEMKPSVRPPGRDGNKLLIAPLYPGSGPKQGEKNIAVPSFHNEALFAVDISDLNQKLTVEINTYSRNNTR